MAHNNLQKKPIGSRRGFPQDPVLEAAWREELKKYSESQAGRGEKGTVIGGNKSTMQFFQKGPKHIKVQEGWERVRFLLRFVLISRTNLCSGQK